MRIGFTGTQRGMTSNQLTTVKKLITASLLSIKEAHIGDCIGADEEFYRLIRDITFKHVIVIGHIPDNDSKRAFCHYDLTKLPKSYLNRNHNIVDESDMLIATPGEDKEQLRSGTWATIRYARKQKVKTIIVWPNGNFSVENS